MVRSSHRGRMTAPRGCGRSGSDGGEAVSLRSSGISEPAAKPESTEIPRTTEIPKSTEIPEADSLSQG